MPCVLYIFTTVIIIYCLINDTFLFHLDSLIPVTTVQLGESATFTCVLPDELNQRQFHWYKQSVGDNLELVVSHRKKTNPVFGPEYSASRVDLKVHMSISYLTIFKTTEEDEGIYHCAVKDWAKITWSGTYLSLKGNYVFCFFQYKHSL